MKLVLDACVAISMLVEEKALPQKGSLKAAEE
jgi:predicted nucleic acid-binding protein